MKSRFLVVFLLVALAGCREPADAGQSASAGSAPEANAAMQADATATPEPAPSAAPNVSCAGVPGCNPLPSGLAVTIPFEVRSDRVYTHASGADRRQVVMEFFEGDPASVLASLQRDFNAAGYENMPGTTTPEGVETMVFNLPGKASVNLWVNPAVGPSPVSDKAKGVFGIDYPANIASALASAPAG